MTRTNATPKPNLLTVSEAKALDLPRMTELFTTHLNPGQLHFMKLLGFHKVKIERAEGMYYYDQDGRPILDFFGGFGSLAFGHNHPRILEARRQFEEEMRHEIAIAFMSQYATALAYDIAACSPGDLDMVFLGSSGSEAMEAAIKVAERAAGPEKPKIVYGKTHFTGRPRAFCPSRMAGFIAANSSLSTTLYGFPSVTLLPLKTRFVRTRKSG